MTEHPVQILVIEDDIPTQTLIRDVLECRGYACMTANSAEEGLSLLGTFCPALILLDINLPGIDGVAAAQHLRGSPATRAIKLVGMSAHALVNEISLIETADFDDFITKPFSYKALLHIVETVMNVEKSDDRNSPQ
ncbi:response regulator [Pseudomonas sp. CrR25]|nr:response regulator [Pseudomonas sp. CrR25]